MKTIRVFYFAPILVACFCVGCVSSSPPPPVQTITYLSVKKPQGVIKTVGSNAVKKNFSRGGLYLVNWNFRPAPDVASYLNQASQVAGNDILRNADITFQVPFFIDILFFGYNAGKDTITVWGE